MDSWGRKGSRWQQNAECQMVDEDRTLDSEKSVFSQLAKNDKQKSPKAAKSWWKILTL